MSALATPDIDISTDTSTETETPFTVILWNDPINLQDDVVKILQKVLEIDRIAAETFMVSAERDSKVAVFSGSSEACYGKYTQLTNYTLTVSVESTS